MKVKFKDSYADGNGESYQKFSEYDLDEAEASKLIKAKVCTEVKSDIEKLKGQLEAAGFEVRPKGKHDKALLQTA